MPFTRPFKRLTVLVACACAVAVACQIPSSSADLSTQISANKATEATLQGQISAESKQIGATANGVAVAEQRYAGIENQLAASMSTLRTVDDEELAASQQLTELEHKLTVAANALASNLRAEYETGSPNLVDVILNANGFSSLLDQVDFMKRVRTQDAQILAFTTKARKHVLAETIRLGKLQARDQNLTRTILAQRNQAAILKASLLDREIQEEQTRSGSKAKLAHIASVVQNQQHELEVEEAAVAAAAAKKARAAQEQQQEEQVNVQASGIPINVGAQVSAPPGSPVQVQEMFAAGNSIATLPYIWGGGHASFQAAGYDCSGSVSFVLNAAGLLSSPETSGALESYGDPGPGKYVTIYANAGHAWMEIAGYRFDTVALAEDGTRWATGGGEFSGFVERHPPGL